MYANFESILEPLERKEEEENTVPINRHASSGWCVYSKFAYGDVPDPMKAYRGKDCVERFIDHIKAEAKRLHRLFPEQLMLLMTEMLKRDYENVSTCHICLKPFDNPEKN